MRRDEAPGNDTTCHVTCHVTSPSWHYSSCTSALQRFALNYCHKNDKTSPAHVYCRQQTGICVEMCKGSGCSFQTCIFKRCAFAHSVCKTTVLWQISDTLLKFAADIKAAWLERKSELASLVWSFCFRSFSYPTYHRVRTKSWRSHTVNLDPEMYFSSWTMDILVDCQPTVSKHWLKANDAVNRHAC